MTEPTHPVDDLLRALAGTPEPSEADREYAYLRLAETIDRSSRSRPPLGGRWKPVWAAAVLAVLVAVFVVSETGRPSPAEATMEEIARVAEMTDPLVVPDGEFVYTQSEIRAPNVIPREDLVGVAYSADNLVYLAVSTRGTWYGRKGTVQIRTTNHDPVFFSDGDEQAYYAAGLDVGDQIGETITTTVVEPAPEDWPTDPGPLDQAIRDTMATDRGLPDTVEYLDVALDIVGGSFSSPELRAATLRLIGRLDGLTLDAASNGTTTFSLRYIDRNVAVHQVFTIDASGYLRSKQLVNISSDDQYGIPADTVILRPLLFGSPDRVGSRIGTGRATNRKT